MTREILAFTAPGWTEIVIPFVLFAIACLIPVLIIFYIIGPLRTNRKENQRLRLEVGKLADELERARKQNESESGAAPTQ